ncbi:DUF7793 family protein [Crocinitomix catalasitica]|uniref:DUF7793 family protein n=1 Tax=Crocinitomix catalasitica TaxID=184607 RepID=UPI0004827370|nr:hypothetical protein [Crocinitomix catalasitica]
MIEFDKSNISLIDHDILYIQLAKDEEIALMDYKQIRLASLRLTGNREVYNLIEIGERTIPNRETREACMADATKGFIIAEAIVVTSLGQRIIAKHILRQQKNIIPRRVFSTVDKAQDWIFELKGQLSPVFIGA